MKKLIFSILFTFFIVNCFSQPSMLFKTSSVIKEQLEKDTTMKLVKSESDRLLYCLKSDTGATRLFLLKEDTCLYYVTKIYTSTPAAVYEAYYNVLVEKYKLIGVYKTSRLFKDAKAFDEGTLQIELSKNPTNVVATFFVYQPNRAPMGWE